VRDATTPAPMVQGARPDPTGAAPVGLRRGAGRRFAGVMPGAIAPTEPCGRTPESAVLRAPAPRGSASVAAVDRVLIGGAAGAAEARIRIGDGAGGSAEIRLTPLTGGRAIAVQVLTAAAGSRETLSDVMNEVRVRLRRRGIALTDVDAADRPSGRRPDGERSR
jgi:hypothetical protein